MVHPAIVEFLELQTVRHDDFASWLCSIMAHWQPPQSHSLPPISIRLVYSSKDGCRPSFKHRDEVQENYSLHAAVQFLLFQMPVWGLVGCTCLWGNGNCGAWELHSFCVVLSVLHSSQKYPGRAGADSCAAVLLLLGWVYFGNQRYYWGGRLWIKKQEMCQGLDRSGGCE